MDLWKALLAEFLGTFTLVFIGAGAAALTTLQGGSLLGTALAFGLVFMTLIYTWGSYSGAHFNPAVSFGYAVAGRMSWGLMICYWIAQLLGGIAAAALIAYIFGTASGVGASVGSLTNTAAWKAVLVEAILTFFLVITILMVTKNKVLALISGVAIGLVLTFDILAGGPLTGASMNPARSLGPALFSGNIGTYWIYVVGPLLGALVAGLVFWLFEGKFGLRKLVDECGNCVKDKCCNQVYVGCEPCIDACGRPVLDSCGKPVTREYHTTWKNAGYGQDLFDVVCDTRVAPATVVNKIRQKTIDKHVEFNIEVEDHRSEEPDVEENLREMMGGPEVDSLRSQMSQMISDENMTPDQTMVSGEIAASDEPVISPSTRRPSLSNIRERLAARVPSPSSLTLSPLPVLVETGASSGAGSLILSPIPTLTAVPSIPLPSPLSLNSPSLVSSPLSLNSPIIVPPSPRASIVSPLLLPPSPRAAIPTISPILTPMPQLSSSSPLTISSAPTLSQLSPQSSLTSLNSLPSTSTDAIVLSSPVRPSPFSQLQPVATPARRVPSVLVR